MPTPTRTTLAGLLAGAALAGPLALLLATLIGAPAPAARAQGGTGADRPDDQPVIAICSVIEVMNDLMDSDRFRPEREEFRRAIQEDEMGPLIDEGRALEQELKGLDPSSDEAKMIQQRIIELRGRLSEMQQRAGARFERFAVEQSIEAYRLVRSSAAAIAEDLGFDYVVSSVPDDIEPRDMPMEAFRNEVLSRTIIATPDGADITDDVRADLNLE